MMPIVQSALTNTTPSQDHLNVFQNQMIQMTSYQNLQQQNQLSVHLGDLPAAHSSPPSPSRSITRLHQHWSTVFDNWQSSNTIDGKIRVWFKQGGEQAYKLFEDKGSKKNAITNVRRIVKVSLYLSNITQDDHLSLVKGPYISNPKKQEWELLLERVMLMIKQGIQSFRSKIDNGSTSLDYNDQTLPTEVRKWSDAYIGRIMGVEDLKLSRWRNDCR